MDKRILYKIKKCLALAKSASNENEAAAAMRSAQALMDKYRISAEDVGFSNINEASIPVSISCVVTYKANFIGLIERAFGVDAVLRKSVFGNEIRFIGIQPQPELAAYCWDVLWPKMIAERSAYVATQSNRCKRSTKMARGDRFAEGWVNGIYAQVTEFARTDAEQHLVDAYYSKHYPNLSTAKSMTRGKKANTGSATRDGYKAGKQHLINRPINGESQRQLSMQ
ncbi:DUF7168 domain-containing protein [Pseudoalteromonas byunsanensis]|uniref:Uncharacterized protein n=1 Tax=Pseudoalteromonas byunsanensis TaxID=327939 RepID=A0A1S1NCI0_9GAMM|nr:DUF2786 domain-containing protein [Pseudoalteromonas byunsanensis]OHU97175.1 hypothetical protein BIW53_02315 [Pseudoalteromonas byunsanensis]